MLSLEDRRGRVKVSPFRTSAPGAAATLPLLDFIPPRRFVEFKFHSAHALGMYKTSISS